MDYSSLSDDELMKMAGLTGPKSVRNNNPGNIRSGQGFASYDSPQAGMEALRNDLTAKLSGKSKVMAGKYGQGYTPTIETVINTWAPPIENDTNGYVDFVSKQSGIPSNTPIGPENLDAIIPAMIQMEGGNEAVDYFAPQPEQPQDFGQMSDAELMAMAGLDQQGLQQEFESKKDGFVDRSGQQLKRRADQQNDIAMQAAEGKISEAEALARIALKEGVKLNDVAGEALTSGFRALPDFIENPIRGAAASGASFIANSPVGDVARSAAKAYQGFAEDNPVAAGRIGSAVDAGNLLLPFAKIGGKSAASTTGAAVEKGLGTAGKVASSAASKVLPGIDDGLMDVAQSARKFNIPLSLDQVTGSRALKTAQKLSQDLPFSGQQAFREKQMNAWQKQIFKTFGVEADKFTPSNMAKAFDKVGGEFDSLTKGKNFNVGGTFADDLAAAADEVPSLYGKEAGDTFTREALKVIDDFGGDEITGELIAKQRARINALARKATGPQAEALRDLENIIVDSITSRDPALQQALTQAKYRYKNLIAVEPLAVKAKGGNISPSLLNNRVARIYGRAHTTGKSGDLGELARIGYELLPELGGSDTAQKMLYAGGTLGVSGLAGIPAVAGTLTANRLGQTVLNRNQGLIDKSLKKASEMKKLQEAFELKKLQKSGNNKADGIKRLPSREDWDWPELPTQENLDVKSRVEKVPLSMARTRQKEMAWDEFNSGKHPAPLFEKYKDKPVAVRMNNGEYLIIDGNHRSVKAINGGEKDMDMYVIDAKDYDPMNAGKKPKPPSKWTDEDQELYNLLNDSKYKGKK